MLKNWKRNKNTILYHLGNVATASFIGCFIGGLLHAVFSNRIVSFIIATLGVLIWWYGYEAPEERIADYRFCSCHCSDKLICW